MSPSKSAAKSYHHGDLRKALIAAALAMLEEGIEPGAVSLREAARRAGVSAMAPYRHFADRETLLAAVAVVGFERFAAALRTADAAPVASEALIAQGVAYVAFACANPALFRLMFGSALAVKHGDLAAAADASYLVMRERVASVAAARADDWALRSWALVHGLASLAVDGQLEDRGESMTQIAERILRLPYVLPGA